MTDILTTAPGSPLVIPTSDPRVQRAIDLVWREADLLDRKQYQAWNAVFDPDGHYVIPIDPEADEPDFAATLNMVYDDARMRDMRVTRMTGGYAISAVDSARTVRTLSRFVPLAVSDTEVRLRCAQALVAYKRGRHDLWAADLEHRVVLSPDGPAGDRISLKVVRLVDSEDVVPSAGFLL
ncbi:aromatic-ring-hydroxylating dioxygenase subunit beta [Streptomyces sp. S.PB5]|uniref:aromatic-ring-hydroxylating dioxygenase subunit beta n=1 Tax=Streptomyces sp. S.PB5 TaxID=3020844 RepID=UPI0025B021AA|nr:aromatic-ring-hydroxylating dioxygenase subunit beta [Streptomyces sp. S.PB5]MDN3028103.1 aromatic-ring-hydroxylating dioxygenase subunit beta [Streptomyces sp. S.PB5]